MPNTKNAKRQREASESPKAVDITNQPSADPASQALSQAETNKQTGLDSETKQMMTGLREEFLAMTQVMKQQEEQFQDQLKGHKTAAHQTKDVWQMVMETMVSVKEQTEFAMKQMEKWTELMEEKVKWMEEKMKWMEERETLRQQVEELRQKQQQEPQLKASAPQRLPDAIKAPQTDPNVDVASFPPLNVHANGPTYRPKAVKNLSRNELFVQRFNNAKSPAELATVVARKDFIRRINGEAPLPKRTESIRSCYVRSNIISKEAKEQGPFKAIRSMFMDVIKLPYMEDISPLGQGFSISEVFYDGAYDEEVRTKFKEHGLLLPDFDPFAPPPHKPDISRETMKEHFCARRAQVYRRGRFTHVREAALAGCDEGMKAKVKALAQVQDRKYKGKHRRSGTTDTTSPTVGVIPSNVRYFLNGAFVLPGSEGERQMLEAERTRNIRMRQLAASTHEDMDTTQA
jgi:hypothetical protein